MINIETDRLRFRQWEAADFPFVAEYFEEAEQTRFLGGTKNREESWRLMASYIGHYQLLGFSYLPVVEKATGSLIGSVGLWGSEPWPELELGYWLHRNRQGLGFAKEAGEAVRDFAFDQLRVKTLVSFIAAENLPSIKLAIKLGAVREGTRELLDFGPHEIYRYTG